MKTNNCGGSSTTCGSGFCGCCEGTKVLTPLSTANRPGLPALSYRIGTHASFLETMKARLASKDHPELAGLTARDSSDPSIALLDAWAAVADVLTFYQERIANEGYLRTATERRSVLELGRLTGYTMRPGVSASAFLAYTLDPNSKDEVVIPASSRAQSVPGPGELPQTFESSEDLKAQAGWNNLRPRMTQPQTETTIRNKDENQKERPRVYLKGINTNLKPNDPLLINFDADNPKVIPELHYVKEVKPDAATDRTLILLDDSTIDNTISRSEFVDLVHNLTKRSSLQPHNSLRMKRVVTEQFAEKAGSGYRTLVSVAPALRESLTAAVKNVTLTKESSASEKKIKIYALRKKAAPFGHNAPLQPVGMDDSKVMKYREWYIKNPIADVEPPNAFFTYVSNGFNVTFTNKSTPINLIDTAIWYFDDDATLSPKILSKPADIFLNQDYTYTAYKEYIVTLLVKGPGGTAKYTEKIEISIPAPA